MILWALARRGIVIGEPHRFRTLLGGQQGYGHRRGSVYCSQCSTMDASEALERVWMQGRLA